MGVTDSWEGKQSFRGERGKSDREGACVRGAQHGDEKDDCVRHHDHHDHDDHHDQDDDDE